MENFISIVKCNSGMASYYISKETGSYTAYLMKSSNESTFPEEVTIDKTKTLYLQTNEADLLTEKLINAIKKAEEREEGIV